MTHSTNSILVPEINPSRRVRNLSIQRSTTGIRLPPHTTFVETNGSLGAALFRKSRSKVEVLNDDDGEAHNFSRVMQMRSSREKLVSAYANDDLVDRLVRHHATDPVARAVKFALAIERSAVKQRPSARSSGRAALRNCSAAGGRLDRVFDRMRDIHIERDSAGTILKRFDWEDALFVCDRRGMDSAKALPVEMIAALNAASGKIILMIDGLPPELRANTNWNQYPGVADAWINYQL